MPILTKRLLVGLTFACLAGLIVPITSYFLIVSYPHNQTVVVDGDIVTITGTSPISLRLYATEVEQETILSNGKDFISTHVGAMPGYYEFMGTIYPGRYQVSGDTASLILSENASIENSGVEQRLQEFNWLMIKMMFIVGFFLGLTVSPAYISN